jgi:hypothetical protein
MTEKEKHEQFYEFAMEYLNKCTPKDIKPELESYLKPVEVSNLSDVYGQLLFSAQNRERAPKVIGDSIGGIDKLRPVLNNFDVHEIIKNYNRPDDDDNVNDIFDKIQKAFHLEIKKKTDKKRDTLWFQFCKSILTGAQFLSQFKDKDDFFTFVNKFDNDERARPAIILLIAENVFGYQLALSCDFLKEIGFIKFGKPDVHVMEIFERCGLAPEVTIKTRKEYEMMMKIKEIAENAGVDAYRLDKIIWLISSRRFYKHNKKMNGRKDDFIKSYLKFIENK